jgi:NADH-quinone oxidoreductase subunit C
MADEASSVAVEATPDSFASRVPALSRVAVSFSRGQEVLHPDRDQIAVVATALREAGFETCSDLCATDYLSAQDHRTLPDGVNLERFEVVVNLLSIQHRRRIRIRVQIPESDPVCPTLFFVYPGTENMEREVYDLFGIVFADHPDMTRILMPPDWEGHPLRKDFGVGRVPVQFKGAPGPR